MGISTNDPPHKMLGFPFINFVEDLNAARNPYPDPGSEQFTYMDQWMGFQGNPEMGYERTVQYEIGVDQNIANTMRLDLTGYYKDANRQTVFREGSYNDPRWDDPNAWTWLFSRLWSPTQPLQTLEGWSSS
jgi:hypothetical protein